MAKLKKFGTKSMILDGKEPKLKKKSLVGYGVKNCIKLFYYTLPKLSQEQDKIIIPLLTKKPILRGLEKKFRITIEELKS